MMPTAFPAPAAALPEVFARDAIIGWFRGEFAAANAIIDALCGHLAQIAGGSPVYEAVFAAVHRRRMNWIPVLHMQRYCSIADVAGELRRVASVPRITKPRDEDVIGYPLKEIEEERSEDSTKNSEVRSEETEEYSAGDSTDQKILEEAEAGDGGCQDGHSLLEKDQIRANHEDCAARPDRIRTCKGFVAKEPLKGHMVNVLKGLKMFEDILTNAELLKIVEFVNELRLVGRRGELSGETFIFFNKNMKGNKREVIQLGVPLFQPAKEEATSNIEPIPPALQTIIDRLAQWRLIPESRMPNSCIINFFDEDEYSQPYFKPPHLDNPISTLVLSETKMAFGRVLVSDPHGNYKASLTLPLKEGSLVVMRGNSADVARHVVCSSSNRRVMVTFAKVRPPNSSSNAVPPPAKAMTIWRPNDPPPKIISDGNGLRYGPQYSAVPSWGMTLRAPVVMLAPAAAPVRGSGGGTGVFLPWNVGTTKKYTKHIPPRIQRRRLQLLHSESAAVSNSAV